MLLLKFLRFFFFCNNFIFTLLFHILSKEYFLCLKRFVKPIYLSKACFNLFLPLYGYLV